jgi:hypothetical protein
VKGRASKDLEVFLGRDTGSPRLFVIEEMGSQVLPSASNLGQTSQALLASLPSKPRLSTFWAMRFAR